MHEAELFTILPIDDLSETYKYIKYALPRSILVIYFYSLYMIDVRKIVPYS